MHSKVEKTYKKVSQIQHILMRPQVYIGSTEETEELMWILEGEEVVQKKIKYVPGLYKIFDEIIVNAADNYQRDKKMTKIEVNIVREEISVLNDGLSIPVQIHKTHKVYIPELIFGHLLTSSNYDDSDKKVTGGRNGFGAKLANLFSTHFSIEAADSANQKKFVLNWTNNMTSMGQPLISNYEGSDYTKVTFRPDFQRFGMSKFSNDMLSLMKRRVYDISGIIKVKVYLNGKLLHIPNFKEYTKMYLQNANDLLAEMNIRNSRWHVIVCRSQGQFMQISFVNGIATTKGGTHVNYIMDQIIDKIICAISKKKGKGPEIKPFQVKSHLKIFINCLIQNPSFDSQTKENLTTNPKAFGSTCIISQEFIKEILKSGIIEKILSDIRNKQSNKIDRELKKVKKNRLVIPKLEDANEAGRSSKCCLILTEGDSAKSLALCGLEQLGRDFFGVYPLKGKPANVKSMTPKQVMQNTQLSNIVKILGLTFEKQYNNTNLLRYNSVMIMADQDNDGSHIKGLVINFFQTFWPSLCKIQGFLKQFITPIIKVKKGTESLNFYSQVDYNKWKEQTNPSGWTIKYYKGLGTSTAKEAKEYFTHLSQHQIHFRYRTEEDRNSIDLAFDKKNADLRKQWLQNYDPQLGIDHRIKKITIEDFVNKELIHFSNSDNIRSIPSVIDGLKPSQRKILFACFKRNLISQMKVAQLAGYVAQHSAYHHGQMSLCSTIVSMAQNFVGSNNLNLLQPIGQFGTRYESGRDAASARYIFTKLNPLTRYLFKQEDDHVVEYQLEENQTIEPKYYLPILPLVLINGAEGIGTGWSTCVYPHKIADVIGLIKERLAGGQPEDICIGWQHFEGAVQRVNNARGHFHAQGIFQVQGTTVRILQIPVTKSIREYKSFLEQKLESATNQDPDIQQLRQYHQNGSIQFVVNFFQDKIPGEGELVKYLKLSSVHQQNNMHLFDASRAIRKYESIKDIVDEFYEVRMGGYTRRKRYLISKFKKESGIVTNQIRFIQQIMNGRFTLMQSKQDWLTKLREGGFSRYQELNQIESTKNREEDQNEKNSDFNYLLTMPIWSFCQEKIRELTSVQHELTTIIQHYTNITEQEMWLKDIQAFEETWIAFQQGKDVKHNSARTSKQILTQHKRERTRQKIQKDEDIEASQGNRNRKLAKKNMMEEQIQRANLPRKRRKLDVGDSDEKPKSLEIELKQQKQSNNSDGIESILSKYLAEDSKKSGELTLLQRIKARISSGDQAFNASYTQARDQLNQSKEKKKDDDEDIAEYLL